MTEVAATTGREGSSLASCIAHRGRLPKILDHPFLRPHGRHAPEENFKHYVCRRPSTQGHARALSFSPASAHMDTLLCSSISAGAITVERSSTVSLRSSPRGCRRPDPPPRRPLAYTSYDPDGHPRGLPREIPAAVLPCYYPRWRDFSSNEAPKPIYGKWIDTYGGEEPGGLWSRPSRPHRPPRRGLGSPPRKASGPRSALLPICLLRVGCSGDGPATKGRAGSGVSLRGMGVYEPTQLADHNRRRRPGVGPGLSMLTRSFHGTTCLTATAHRRARRKPGTEYAPGTALHIRRPTLHAGGPLPAVAYPTTRTPPTSEDARQRC